VIKLLLRCSALTLVLATIMVIQVQTTVTAQEATPVAGCAPMTQADAEAIVDAYWAPWNAHDVSLFGDLIAEDYVHHWGIGEDVTGRDAFVASVAAFVTAFPDLSFTVNEVFLADDVVIHLWTATGTQKEAFGGIPPSDITVTWTGINVSRVECGVIVEGWGEADHFSRLQQQGAIMTLATPEP
jgi:steroid delta-isomerase-like uncharacterized protein